MGDGRTEVVFLWEARAMSEQYLLVSAGSVPAPNTFPYLGRLTYPSPVLLSRPVINVSRLHHIPKLLVTSAQPLYAAMPPARRTHRRNQQLPHQPRRHSQFRALLPTDRIHQARADLLQFGTQRPWYTPQTGSQGAGA
jgi:hypothetical protein